MDRISLINSFKPTRYLEIGVYEGITFRNIAARIKDGIDPAANTPANYHMTSDEFFENVAPMLGYKYDVIFIDGLHYSDQVNRDIVNALAYTTNDGIIILHDCNPISEMRQRIPPDFDIWEYGWNGDVWKSIIWARQTYNYNIYVIDADEGLGVIDKRTTGIPLNMAIPDELTYEFFNDNRRELLNLI
jgi:hypothetical protein